MDIPILFTSPYDSPSRPGAAWRDSTLRGVGDLPGTVPGNRGAPPREVDVKQPSPGGPGAPQGPGRALPGSRSPGRGPRGPGLRIPDPGICQIPGQGLPPGRGGGSRGPGPGLALGVLHQPLAPGPRGTPLGVPGPGSPGTGFRASREAPRPPPRRGGAQTPFFRPRGTAGGRREGLM